MKEQMADILFGVFGAVSVASGLLACSAVFGLVSLPASTDSTAGVPTMAQRARATFDDAWHARTRMPAVFVRHAWRVAPHTEPAAAHDSSATHT